MQRGSQGSAVHSPHVLEVWRRAWHCDCDGVSHEAPGGQPHAAAVAVSRMADAIEERTGMRPPTCPWRAMYHPLVPAALQLSELGEKGLGHAAVDDGTPAVWIDAARVFMRARDATSAKDSKDDHERRMREAKRR